MNTSIQPQEFYYVVDHEEQGGRMIVRAAQSTLRSALTYSTPDRFIVGPMTADTLEKLFPKTRPYAGRPARRSR